MKDVEKYTSEAKIFSDTQKASLTKVAKSGTNLVLTFDEPVSTSANTEIYLDGTKLAASGLTALADASTKLGEYVYTVALASAEQTTAATVGAHSVDVYYVTDAATNTTLKTTGTYSVGTDTTAPSVSKIEAVNSTTFRVYTSEELANLASTNLTIKKGNYTFDSGDYTVSPYNTTDGYYTVTLDSSVLSDATNPLYASGESSVALSVGVSGIIDNAGLVGNNYSGSVTLSKDTTAPKLVSDSANYADVTNKFLYVKLDEDVASVEDTKITVRDADGLKQTVVGATAVQGKGETGTTEYLQIELSALTSTSYTVNLGAGAVEDSASNANTSTLTSNVAVKAVGAEQLALAYGSEVTVANNVISINYGKEMGSSAISLANYKFNDGAFPTGTTINWGADKQNVEIVLPDNTFAKDTTGVLTVTSGVKTDEGKAIYADSDLTTENVIKLGATDINDNIAPTLTKAAYVVANSSDVTSNKLRLTFSEAVALDVTAANNVDDLAVKIGDKTIAVTAVEAGSSSNVLELTLADTVAVSQSAIVSVVTDKLVNTTGINITDASTLANKLAAGSATATTKEQ